jgi:hypothetical protein
MDRDEMSILYRGLSIDASYQVSVHLAGFQRRRLKCELIKTEKFTGPKSVLLVLNQRTDNRVAK